MKRLFLYGTLKRGHSNHRLMAGQKFIGTARTRPVYRLYDMGGYPGLVRDANGVRVTGEVWEVDDAALAALDRLEDVDGGEYRRELIDLEPPDDGKSIEGYLFLLDVQGRPDAGDQW